MPTHTCCCILMVIICIICTGSDRTSPGDDTNYLRATWSQRRTSNQFSLFSLIITLISMIIIKTFCFLLLLSPFRRHKLLLNVKRKKSLTIPVNIRVTDANDNSPIFRNSTYFINISEVFLLLFLFSK